MRLNRRHFLFSIPASASLALGQKPVSSAQMLWYRQPAAKWVEALPIGNGRLGAMIFGGISKEQLQLNEDSVWVGSKRTDRINPAASAAIPKVRQLLFQGKV